MATSAAVLVTLTAEEREIIADDPEADNDTPTVAEAVHASTLASPRAISNNGDMLDKAAPETIETQNTKKTLIGKIQSAFTAIRQYRLGKGPLQATLIGRLAELLLLKPTNKELAEAMTEPYQEAADGPDMITRTVHSDEYVDHREGNLKDEFTTPTTKKGLALHPKPYAQAARRYKTLARIEANLPEDDWDVEKFNAIRETGIKINSVDYASPVAALMSGNVTMEAVFQAYTNILAPRVKDLSVWSTSHVEESKQFAPKVKVTVRKFDKKMNREQKVSVTAVHSASCLYGLLMGLLTWQPENETKEPICISRERADKIIAAVNARVSVHDAEPVTV